MLVWRKGNIIKNCLSLCYSIVYYYNGAQRYEQFFLQVDCIELWSCLGWGPCKNGLIYLQIYVIYNGKITPVYGLLTWYLIQRCVISSGFSVTAWVRHVWNLIVGLICLALGVSWHNVIGYIIPNINNSTIRTICLQRGKNVL